MTTTEEWEAQRAAERAIDNAGGGCISCLHGFHLHTCPAAGCLCDNQGRTETMRDRRDRFEKQRLEDEAWQQDRVAKIAAVIRAELSLGDWDGDQLFEGAIDPGELAEAIARGLGG